MPKNRYYDGPASDHFDGRFFNTAPPTRDKTLADIRRWRRTSQRTHWPARVPVHPAMPDARVDGTRITLVGHATVLIQTGGLNLLTDPAEAVRILQDLDAKQAIAIHWGVFPLSDEGRDAPVHELGLALRAHGIAPARFRHDEPGGVIAISPFSGGGDPAVRQSAPR